MTTPLHNSRTAPLIGITTYGRDEGNRFTLPGEYVDAVRRAGGIPLLIAPGESQVDDVLAILDGLVLAGGGDLCPTLYGGSMHESIYMVDSERDNSELELARTIIKAGFPTLAICRGAQLVNIALGGNLHEHLPDVVGEEILHRLPPREPVEHQVTIDADSRLAAAMGETDVSTASWHHQAIRDVAPALTVTARAPDGTIEAVEAREHPWLLAVQWHPELTAARDAHQQRLFNALVETAQQTKT
ncbi:putative glutamine amidotransferase [Symmachiella macrocystis]|uniref:Putative glutamine amidotransferase n=1 Tax=Symmachiella macrocystis TaxID=2527985 RepID=A0A5C6BVC7_9PLAN|nr:gamma-glutamyl-gamma-aminobutyrate hydrolase family protein [Symmachiella macrocystis]TWU14629.1 putative glutamine amidotransferase [Symmachiella macrocystis]